MNKLFFVFICMLCSNISFSQEVNSYQLLGKWRIVGYKGLEIITPGMENENEKTERLKLSSRRSSGLFDIDSNWISTNNSFLDFDSCKFTLVHNQHQELNIVNNDFSSGYSSSFDIDIANNRVSEDFIKLLDKNYSKRKLSIFNTDYKELGTGYESMKICIVSPNKIGLYRDYDLIILERKVNHK